MQGSKNYRLISWCSIGAVGLVVFGLFPLVATAAPYRRPTVIVRPQAVVRGPVITLGEIAEVSAESPEHSDLVAALKGARLADAPAPMTTTTLLAANILQSIEGLGVSPDTIGYSVPNTVTVERAGRIVSQEEVLNAVRKEVTSDLTLDLQVREVVWPNSQVIPEGPSLVRVERLGQPQGGKIPLRVEVLVGQLPAARFLATAMVDDWREIPVLRRSLERGMLISPGDVQLVRLNLHKQPEDVAENLDLVLGRRVLHRLQAGESIRKRQIEIPPMIKKGKRVSMAISRGPLQASATGVAINDGAAGDLITVKNDASGKLVRGKVVSPETVEVTLE